jgi:hypothetical protein
MDCSVRRGIIIRNVTALRKRLDNIDLKLDLNGRIKFVWYKYHLRLRETITVKLRKGTGKKRKYIRNGKAADADSCKGINTYLNQQKYIHIGCNTVT